MITTKDNRKKNYVYHIGQYTFDLLRAPQSEHAHYLIAHIRSILHKLRP